MKTVTRQVSDLVCDVSLFNVYQCNIYQCLAYSKIGTRVTDQVREGIASRLTFMNAIKFVGFRMQNEKRKI